MNGNKGLTREAVKYLAVLAMTLDHIAQMFLATDSWIYLLFTGIGNFTAITMCVLLTEGYRRTGSFYRYARRLLVFGCISQLPFRFAFGTWSLNICFTLLIILLLLRVQDTGADPWKTAGLVFASAFCDWPVLLAGAGLLYYKAGDDRQKKRRVFWLLTLVTGFGDALYAAQTGRPVFVVMAGILAAAAVLGSMAVTQYAYHGRTAGRMRAFHKWFFYVYYPAHLVLLILIRYLQETCGVF